MTVVVAMCLVFGVWMLATGGRYPYRNVERQTLTPIGWVLIAVVAAAALGGYFAVDAALRARGYA